MARATVVLPLPLSPTTPSVWPTHTWRSTPSTARIDALRRLEVDLGVVGLDQDLGGRAPRLNQRTASVAARKCSAGGGTTCQRRQAERWRVRDLGQRRARRGARLFHEAATGREDAAGRQLVDAWDRARDGGSRERFCGVGSKCGTQPSRSSVYGCSGRLKSTFSSACSMNSPAYITPTRCADLGDHTEVVGDVEDRRVELTLELGDEVQDDGLGGHVQGRRRLRP